MQLEQPEILRTDVLAADEEKLDRAVTLLNASLARRPAGLTIGMPLGVTDERTAERWRRRLARFGVELPLERVRVAGPQRARQAEIHVLIGQAAIVRPIVGRIRTAASRYSELLVEGVLQTHGDLMMPV